MDWTKLVIEGFRAKRAYITFWADFHFLQDGTYFWETDLFLHEKHQSVIIFADLRFIFESPPFQIGSSFVRSRASREARENFEIMSKITP